jgi:hypothetical protein
MTTLALTSVAGLGGPKPCSDKATISARRNLFTPALSAMDSGAPASSILDPRACTQDLWLMDVAKDL